MLPGKDLLSRCKPDVFSTVWVMGTFLESPKGPASTGGTTYGFLGFSYNVCHILRIESAVLDEMHLPSYCL